MDRRLHARTLAAALVAASLAAACGGGSGAVELDGLAERGRTVAIDSGCAACHGVEGQGGVGPGWHGLYGSDVDLADGRTVVADDAYLRRSIVDPEADQVAGFTIAMPESSLDEEEIAAVLAYIRSLE